MNLNLTKPEKTVILIVAIIALVLLAQISANTGPAPEQPCMKIGPDGIVPCAIS